MKKRNKIRLPHLEDEGRPETNEAAGKLNIEHLQDSFDEEEPLPLVGGIKKIVQIPIEADDTTNEQHEYDPLFKKNVEILNLEDIDFKPNSRKQLQASFQTDPDLSEKAYVKLLERDEEREITDRIRKFNAEDDYRDHSQESEEDRLPLSGREKKLQDARRKKLIQDVIAEDSNDAGSREWEANLMNRVKIHAEPSLPSLYEKPIDEGALEQELSKVRQRKKQLKGQLMILKHSQDCLKGEKRNLLASIRDLFAD